jgi:hypothetical protein
MKEHYDLKTTLKSLTDIAFADVMVKSYSQSDTKNVTQAQNVKSSKMNNLYSGYELDKKSLTKNSNNQNYINYCAIELLSAVKSIKKDYQNYKANKGLTRQKLDYEKRLFDVILLTGDGIYEESFLNISDEMTISIKKFINDKNIYKRELEEPLIKDDSIKEEARRRMK